MTEEKDKVISEMLPGLRKRPGENDDAYYRRAAAWIAGEDVRTKTDLKDWTGSYPFHLDKPS